VAIRQVLQLSKTVIDLIKKNPELAEELGKIGKTVSKVIKGKPTRFTAGQKAKVRLYVDPNGNKYTSVRKGLEDIESGKAVPKATWSQLKKEERVQITGEKKVTEKKTKKEKEYTAEEKETAAKRVRITKEKAKKYQRELHKRIDIKPSRVKEGGEKYKENMQKVVNILGNETTNMRNLRQAGEKQRGGITGLIKSSPVFSSTNPLGSLDSPLYQISFVIR